MVLNCAPNVKLFEAQFKTMRPFVILSAAIECASNPILFEAQLWFGTCDVGSTHFGACIQF